MSSESAAEALANALSRLNAGANEFVPTFSSFVPNIAPQAYQQQPQQQHYQKPNYYNPNNPNQYNNQNSNYNPNYQQQPQQYHQQTSSNYKGKNPNPNHQYNSNQNWTPPSSHNNNSRNNHHHSNPNDVDPIEIEARCEAVIEILGDEKIREHLNPQSLYENDSAYQHISASSSSSRYTNNIEEDQVQNCDDEEEMMEMMAMQEECRLEMMKFYVQSQNPKLFEEIYHDVSYPDNKMKDLKIAAAANALETAAQLQQQLLASQEPIKHSYATNEKALKDLIVLNLNPKAGEFTPNKFSA